MQENNLEEVKTVAEEMSTSMIRRSESCYIKNKNDLNVAAEMYAHAKDQIKVIEEAFKTHKTNARKAHKDLCDAESEQILPFRKVQALLKPKMVAYQTALEKKRQADEKAENEKLREAIKENPNAVPEMSTPVPQEKIKGAGTRETWTYEVEDFETLPDEYKLENDKALGGIARTMKKQAKVPGVRFYKKIGLSGR